MILMTPNLYIRFECCPWLHHRPLPDRMFFNQKLMISIQLRTGFKIVVLKKGFYSQNSLSLETNSIYQSLSFFSWEISNIRVENWDVEGLLKCHKIEKWIFVQIDLADTMTDEAWILASNWSAWLSWPLIGWWYLGDTLLTQWPPRLTWITDSLDWVNITVPLYTSASVL